jgi:hypothetical protein
MVNGIPNALVSWEKVETQNIGIDFSVLKGKVEVNLDMYKKTTRDMLLFTQGTTFLGIGSNWDDLKAPIGNVGNMSNTGLDLSINTTNISKNDFTWKSNIIFSSYKNKLNQLLNATASIDGRVYYDRSLITKTLPGNPVGSFWGLKTDGLFRTPAELASSYPQFGLAVAQDKTWLGDVRFKDTPTLAALYQNSLMALPIHSPIKVSTWLFSFREVMAPKYLIILNGKQKDYLILSITS